MWRICFTEADDRFNLVIEKLLIPTYRECAAWKREDQFQSRNRETFDSNC